MKHNRTDRWAILTAIIALAILWFLYGRWGWASAPAIAPAAIDPTPAVEADTNIDAGGTDAGDAQAPEQADTNTLPDWLVYLRDNDFTASKSVAEYAGDAIITRATSTPFLARYGFVNKLEEKSTVAECNFPDITTKSEDLQKTITVACAYDLLRWSNGNFLPDRVMTKDELLTVLVRTKTGFLDETTTPWFKNYFDRAVNNNLVDANTPIGEFSGQVTKKDIGQRLYRLSLVK